VGRFLAKVAGPAGTLLVLDDLQWAGPDALDLLATLVRSAAVPLRVVGAYRSTEVQPHEPLGVMPADLAHAGLAVHRTLAPHTPEEVGQLPDVLLARVEGDRTVLGERVVRRAGGVPFFVVSCAQGLCVQAAGHGGEDEVPWDLAHGIRQRVAALPEGAQELLGVAAVAGRVASYELLRTVAARPEPDVLVVLEGANRSQLLLEEGARAYRFAHDVIREVIEAQLSTARRIALHRRIAQSLEQEAGERAVELPGLPTTGSPWWMRCG
jgi:predicted ATPase